MMQWEKPILPRRITEIAQRLRSSSTDLVLSLSSGIDKRHQQHVGLKYGYLHKSSFRIKRWTQAWFVLEARELTYYDGEQVNEPKVISLKSQCSVIEADINETKRSFSFKIAIQRRTFVLAAESRASMEEWINALRAISGLYQSPPPSLSSAPPVEQAIQLLQALENMLSVCSKVVSQASNCQVPGVCDQNKLATITAAALKCASSGRVVAFRPTAVTASQQLASSLSEISEHARKYNDVLKVVSATGRKVEVDVLLDSTESLYSLTASLFDKCVPEPEPPTEQETILVTCRNATTSASSVFAAAREKDINRLVEVSKLLVTAVTSLYEATRAIEKGNSKHAQPKALAHRCLALARDLIAKAKAFHISTRKDDETEASLAAVKLQEQIAAVVGAAQAAGQHLIIDQQLSEAVAIIQNSANDMRESTDITPIIANGEDEISNSQVITKEAAYSTRLVECANCLGEAISSLPNAIKQCSKTTLFNVAKVIGTSTNSLVKSAAEFSALYPSHDPNFIARLSQSIRAMQSSGWQLLSMAKVVIQEEFKNQSDLLQTSGMAQSHAVCVAYILSELKSQITLKNSKPDGDEEKGSTTSFTTTSSSSDSDLSLSAEFSIVPLSSRDSSFFGSHRDISTLGRSSPLFFKKDHLRPTTSKRILQMVLDEDQSIENEDVDIWNEPPDSDENIIVGVNEDGETYTKAATLNKLIIKLTNENDHDIKFQKTFIITYRSFTTPTRLLKKLMQRYNVIIPKLPPAISSTEYRKKSVLPIQLRVINVLKMWIETAFYDMNDDLIRKLRHFTENVLVMDGHNALANQIGAIIDRQLKVRHADEFPQFPPYVPLPDQTASLETHSEEEIAQQLTKVDFELYITIKPVELLNQAWNKESLKHRAPNILAMISRFNAISTWAASVILWKQTIKERVTLWVKLVTVTEHLLKLNNFNTALAIISGLNSSATYRLKYTRAELPKKTQLQFESVMQLMNSEGSYKAYRDALHNANPPCVPYLGVYLTDVTFIEDGNKDFIHSLINFRKRQLVAEVVTEIQLYQQFPYDLPKNDSLLSLFHHLPSSTEEQLYQISLLREPRNAERGDVA